MSYLSPEEYQEITGKPSPENYKILERQARGVIDRLTGGEITTIGFEKLCKPLEDAIKQSMAEEISFLDDNGGLEGLSAYNSASLGKFSYTSGDMGSTSPDVAPGVIDILMFTGLLYRGRMVIP